MIDPRISPSIFTRALARSEETPPLMKSAVLSVDASGHPMITYVCFIGQKLAADIAAALLEATKEDAEIRDRLAKEKERLSALLSERPIVAAQRRSRRKKP